MTAANRNIALYPWYKLLQSLAFSQAYVFFGVICITGLAFAARRLPINAIV